MSREDSSSVTKPPFFDGSNYPYWKARMRIFLESIDSDVRDMIDIGYKPPMVTICKEGEPDVLKPKEKAMWTDYDKAQRVCNAKGLNAIFCSVSKDEFGRFKIVQPLSKHGTSLKLLMKEQALLKTQNFSASPHNLKILLWRSMKHLLTSIPS